MKDRAENLKYIIAKNKVEKEKGLYTHLFIYIVVNLVITGFKVNNSLDSWDSFIDKIIGIDVLSTWVIWGIFLILHFVSFKYGLAWEERKIEKLMNKELSNNSKDYRDGKI